MASNEEMSTCFGSAAGTYETGRPDYPIQAVDWMLQPVVGGERSIRVADVGAGTGKLTRSVVELGAEVVAIDPDPKMLTVLREHVHGVPTFVGTAENLPVPDASLDAVLLGQAWHWVDPDAGAAEAARVLRSGGVLGLIWNIRDDSVDWVRRMTAIMHGSRAEQMLGQGVPPVAEPFGEVEDAQWRWSRAMTRESLLAMARSRSYLITAAPDERARVEAGLHELFDELGAVGDAVVQLPYVTRAYRALRP
ncbi:MULTISPECIES: class I SAM-dependent methyltransferase [unclassified Microbacterium]|uniref:class I SAM-dependent methyltransferase n=1 Tax=unclassified Microbacterium TaxID=2609290 RepID=UPI00214B04D5|nr:MULTISPECIES: class I SAM-dependent methyltransferase [unclassified Microbacterium]MCR2809728.1 class I SAM-dependent methyltransferase [Microbacterium sp. zg.B185]WIM17957.1 class I SAM-dependent methyltransferase [Microbacterium sp. zg-B185]